MAPTIALRNKEDDSADLQTHHKTRMVWVIVTVVLVSLAFLAVVVILTFRWYKARNQKQAANNSPYMSKKDMARRRNMSDLDRMEEDELQRQFMIRKSLASRTSFRTDSRLCQSLSEEPLDMADDESSTASLKSDWKEFEAKLHHERTLSFEKHPAEKPPKTSTACLAVPTPARSESPSLHYYRTPPPRSSASPALPRIPSEESLNLKTPRLSCSSTASTNTKAGSHWDKSRIIVIGYDRLESSED